MRARTKVVAAEKTSGTRGSAKRAKEPLDVNADDLRATLVGAAAYYAPDEVREIVCVLFKGQNYRGLTEKPTRQAISVFAAWILNVAHRARLLYGQEWVEKLLEQIPRQRASKEERWLKFWLLGLTEKTAVNLGVRSSGYAEYLQRARESNREVIRKLQWPPTSVQFIAGRLKSIRLSPEDSVWLLQIAGAAALSIRGSYKSIAGKRLEKAIARAALTALGLKEKTDFLLNIQRGLELEREVDALIYTRHGSIKMDIALIGTGNQEVSEDKLARVGKNGIVLVDKLGPKSQVLKNAARHEVEVVQLRNNFALTGLHSHLQGLVRDNVTLNKPPADESGIVELLQGLPASAYELPQVGA